MIDKKSLDFVFVVPKLKINKVILELCVGNHAMYMKRRKPDSMEVQQMKIQAQEEKTRKQMERDQLMREKVLREEAQREKEELLLRMQELQEQFRMAQDSMVRSEEAADLLAEKVRVAEEESFLLSRKAAEAEAEKQRLHLAAMKTEEEKLLMEMRAREAELMTSRIVEECERRAHEAQQLRAELNAARIAEKSARQKYQDFMRTCSVFGNFGSAAGVTEVSELHMTSADLCNEYDLQQQQSSDVGLVTSNLVTLSCDMTNTADMDTLSREIEKEKEEYWEKSRNLREHLKEIRSEIEVLKVEEKQSQMDSIHEQNLLRGTNKYATLGKAKSSSAKARIQFYEEL
jgi:merlin protein